MGWGESGQQILTMFITLKTHLVQKLVAGDTGTADVQVQRIQTVNKYHSRLTPCLSLELSTDCVLSISPDGTGFMQHDRYRTADEFRRQRLMLSFVIYCRSSEKYASQC